MPDAFLDAAAIRTATFVRHVEVHDTLGSTNDRAAELARNNDIQLPALVAARHQTAGRGRGSNEWLSSEGALTFSVLLEPASLGISTSHWPQLSLATGLAVCDAISDEFNPQSAIPNPQSPRLAIKWPNDVMLDGAKVCGILIESPGGPAPAKDRLVVGIGINVNNSWRSVPRTDGPIGIALCDATGKSHDLNELLVRLLQTFTSRLNQLAENNSQLSSDFQQLSWLTGKRVEVESNGNSIEGICIGLDSDGALLIENVFGTHRVCSGSVRVR